jgi:uncharacterized protein
MIIYQSNKKEFIEDIATDGIELRIQTLFKERTGKNITESQVKAWQKSLRYMRDVLLDPDIPPLAGVAIEFQIPQTSKRIDFILTGQNEDNIDHGIIIELKQWDHADLSDKDGIVDTPFYGEVSHPSYQAWSYASLLQNFNEAVYQDGIQLKPCAYLHNYIPDTVIKNDFYAAYLEKAPVFLEGNAEKEKLQAFIKQFVRFGDAKEILYRIDNGRIRPSKGLADSLVLMLQGNPEFIMIDDQKVVFETAVALAKKSTSKEKKVLIVSGGPGTGKSVIAINLIVALTKLGLFTQYVSKNAAPRDVYSSKLTGSMRKTDISNMFSGSGAFIDKERSIFDALIVDEAHRLNEKSGLYQNLGENQIKELIEASKFTLFFVDEDQKVTLSDIGDVQAISEWANTLGAQVHTMTLSSQFRCNGSDEYVAWLDNTLQIHETANTILDTKEYDFQIVGSPSKLREMIYEKNEENNRARMVAGYCWKWVSKKTPVLYDINLEDGKFHARWNLTTDGNFWIVAKDSVQEVGCIHTCQGLDVDYVGVIIGPDMLYRNGRIVTDASQRASSDSSVKGYKKLLEEHPIDGALKLDRIIKNTYRTLMTRGMKGCYVYCTDKETQKYFETKII